MSKLFERFVRVEVMGAVIRVKGARTAHVYDAPEHEVNAERDPDFEESAREIRNVLESHSRAAFEATRDEVLARVRATLDGTGIGAKTENAIVDSIRNLDFDALVRNTIKP